MPNTVFRSRRCGAAILLAAACTSCPAAGPDITHGEITDAGHYGPVGTIHAYAWGSGTCNIGSTSLSWVNGGTPALGMNAYRLHNGRLMQIGMGFCKHACCVANGAGCGTCTSTGFGLRPGCRDVYGAGFNAGQGRLGPRSGINAYERTFSAIPSGSGDAIWRRVQVQQADMASTQTGALYFAEGVYVCLEEDPSAALNNASYRRCTVANTGASPSYVWTVADTTRATQPAINAWRDYGRGISQPDTSVILTTVDLLDEGRFHAAGKVTDLGNGTWQYEYAVFNLNSSRSGASFTLPIEAGAAAMNAGFHSPPYHSGEPYSNAPWAFTAGARDVSWSSPQTFQQNPNANALRWGTMYNFWFTSPVRPAPNTGSATLGLFRPGTPTSVPINGLPVPCQSPVIASQPRASVQACQCVPLELPVVIAANASAGAPAYQWQREVAAGSGQWTNLADGAREGCPGGAVTGTAGATLRLTGPTARDSGLYRCVITTACGAATTTPTQVSVCVGDFNCDGGADGTDVVDFFGVWESGEMSADTNLDGGVDGNDVQTFFVRWQGGC
jgi:hypothetical protein